MRYFFNFFFFLLFCSQISAQQKLTLQEIWQGNFSPTYLTEVTPLRNGTEYATFEYDIANRETKIVATSYTNKTDSRVVLSAFDIEELPYFESFEFSDDEQKVLLGANFESLYRYSKSGIYTVYDFKSKSILFQNNEPIFNPAFSPDGNYLAFVQNNNLYVYNFAKAEQIAITNDGKWGAVINGKSDWVYEEELEITRAFQWNKGSTHIVFLKFNEKEVKEYALLKYGDENYPEIETYKYPKAGEQNSKVSLQLYSLESNTILSVDLKGVDYEYIPRLQATNNANQWCVQTLNRAQNKLSFSYVDTLANVTPNFYQEKSETYVEITDDLTFLKDNSFVKTTENSGYRHIYHFSSQGKLIKQITSGNWEVTDFYGIHNGYVYYQSTEKGSTQRQVYKIKLNGKNKQCLTLNVGTNKPFFSSNYQYFINKHSSLNTPLNYTVVESKSAKMVDTLLTNASLKEKLSAYNLPKKNISTIKISGAQMNMWLIKPADFDANKKYPLLLYQYGGPGSQMVSDSWNSYDDYWHFLLSQKGYIVACLDGRGTGYKGAKFKKQTQNELGKLEAEDQIAFAMHLGALPFVDANRIGIWGWSFGGFNALNAILKDNNVFKTAIAVAPVTHWKFYDTIYTERFLGTPQNNASGYDANSPLNHAGKLKANLLLIHGTLDDNVHYQNTLAMTKALTEANRLFDIAIYTDKNHGIYGGNTRVHLYQKMTDYILEKL